MVSASWAEEKRGDCESEQGRIEGRKNKTSVDLGFKSSNIP